MGEPKSDDKGNTADQDTGGRVEKQIKRIGDKVDKIDARLQTYEEISGAGEEAERKREEEARRQTEEALRKKPDEKPDEEEPAISDEENGLLDIWE